MVLFESILFRLYTILILVFFTVGCDSEPTLEQSASTVIAPRYFIGKPSFSSPRAKTELETALSQQTINGNRLEFAIAPTIDDTRGTNDRANDAQDSECDRWDILDAIPETLLRTTKPYQVRGVYGVMSDAARNSENCPSVSGRSAPRSPRVWLYPNVQLWDTGVPITFVLDGAHPVTFENPQCRQHKQYFLFFGHPSTEVFLPYFPDAHVLPSGGSADRRMVFRQAGLLNPSGRDQLLDRKGQACATKAVSTLVEILDEPDSQDFLNAFHLRDVITDVKQRRHVEEYFLPEIGHPDGTWSGGAQYRLRPGMTPWFDLHLNWTGKAKKTGSVNLTINDSRIVCNSAFPRGTFVDGSSPTPLNQILAICEKWIHRVYTEDVEHCGHLIVSRNGVPVSRVGNSAAKLRLKKLLDGPYDSREVSNP